MASSPAAATTPIVGLRTASQSLLLPAPRPRIALSSYSRGNGIAISKGHTVPRNVVAKVAGESPADVSTETPEIVKTIIDTWDKLEDKYAVASLGFIGLIVLWTATGIISAIDRVPVVPGILELVGIGYTGWFTYQNLIFQPDREALIEKMKCTYNDVIGNRRS